MSKHLMLIHGRSFKPDKEDLKKLWFGAIRHGLNRDGHKKALYAFDHGLTKTFIYYGDISSVFLSPNGADYDQDADLNDRVKCFNNLKNYQSSDQFLRPTGKSNYENLEGVSKLKEWLVDTFAGILETFGLAELLIRQFAEDIECYWNPDSEFGTDVRWRLTEPLQKALEDGDDIFLVSHSLGTMIAYDVLWKFSHYGEYKELRENGNNLTTLITLGSPLGNETVKKKLKGARARGNRKFPTLIQYWENFAAEGDYISHDETLKDDYRKMERARLVNSICDHRLYNLAVRNGKSNPHHGVGYLIHPWFIDVLGNWLVE